MITSPHSRENQPKTKKVEFPLWLEEIFYKYALTYGKAWTTNIHSPMDLEALKTLYYNSLINFKPQTITRACDESLKRLDYPSIKKLVEICDEFSKTNKYESQALTYEYKPTLDANGNKIIKKTAQNAIQAIRDKLKYNSRR